MRIILALLTLLIPFALAAPAQAGEIYECGEPVENTLGTETIGVCDFYSRQFKYRIKANDLRERIKARQKAFQAPAREARERYAENLKKLNQERGTQPYKDDSDVEEKTDNIEDDEDLSLDD